MSAYYNEKFSDCEKIRERIEELKIGDKVAAAPRVSIIIPAYKIARFIAETLETILTQTFADYEIIIINDGSPDTPELEKTLKPFQEQIIYARQSNGGASKARNLAICLARGELFAFLDGDDLWFPEHLEKLVKFLDENRLEMVYSDAVLFGEAMFEGKLYSDDAPSNGEITPECLIAAECNVITSGTIVKKNCLEKFDLFDVSLTRMQDFDMWFRLARNCVKIGFSDQVTVKYRVHTTSLSGTNVERAERNIRAMNVISEKYDLTETERAAWNRQMAFSVAECELERGKLCFVREEYDEARRHFIAANRFYRKTKLKLLIEMIKISPKFARRLFQNLRPAEYSFIEPEKS